MVYRVFRSCLTPLFSIKCFFQAWLLFSTSYDDRASCLRSGANIVAFRAIPRTRSGDSTDGVSQCLDRFD